MRTRSAGAQPRFKPTEVYVQGFYDWTKGTGAIDEEEADRHVAKLLANVEKGLKDKFVVDKQYPSFRRICFTSSTGGED